jgi:hypothetical protein
MPTSVVFTTSCFHFDKLKDIVNHNSFLLKPISRESLCDVISKKGAYCNEFFNNIKSMEKKLVVKMGQYHFVTELREIASLSRKESFTILERRDGKKLPIKIDINTVVGSLQSKDLIGVTPDLFVHMDCLEEYSGQSNQL